jgi:hypothetical protein
LLHNRFQADDIKARLAFPAPTVAELGVLLGDRRRNVSIRFDKELNKTPYILTFVEGFIKTGLGGGYMSFHETEAQARAAALIWLIENGHLKADELSL